MQSTKTLGLPVVVKPNKQGSTVGLTVVREAGAARQRRSSRRIATTTRS